MLENRLIHLIPHNIHSLRCLDEALGGSSPISDYMSQMGDRTILLSDEVQLGIDQALRGATDRDDAVSAFVEEVRTKLAA